MLVEETLSESANIRFYYGIDRVANERMDHLTVSSRLYYYNFYY